MLFALWVASASPALASETASTESVWSWSYWWDALAKRTEVKDAHDRYANQD